MSAVINHLFCRMDELSFYPQKKTHLTNQLFLKFDLVVFNYESCKLSFIWGKMRTAAQAMTPQIALRDCFKEVRGKGQYI